MEGLRHLALWVTDLEACEHFYVALLGMRVEWRPDADNLYLTSGLDNLALHRAKEARSGLQSLDHLGFILKTPEDVDSWHQYLSDAGVKIIAAPKTHRDGARSFYCQDPDSNTVQFIFHTPISGLKLT
ncbi:MAG TPA: glyoxalase [Gammaproteobacteria bacterium]|nr:glyoxalase [Gammaproteobacteria bacterium]